MNRMDELEKYRKIIRQQEEFASFTDNEFEQLAQQMQVKTFAKGQVLFDDDYNLKNPNIPVLFGGLDHISKTKKYFTFHDIGCNGRDNSFRIGDANPIGETK